MRLSSCLLLLGALSTVMCFAYRDRRRTSRRATREVRNDWANVWHDPGWADPKPLDRRGRRRLSASRRERSQTGSQHRRRKKKQCLLLDKLPYELRREIYAYALGHDAVHIVPRRKRHGHVSLVENHPVAIIRGDKVGVTDAATIGYDPSQAVLLPKYVRSYGHKIQRIKLAPDLEFTSSTCIYAPRISSAMRRIQLWSTESHPITPDNHNVLNLYDIGSRSFETPYRVSDRFRNDQGRKITYVSVDGDVKQLGSKLGLLRTCHQIYREGIDLLYAQNTFVFSDPYVFNTFPDCVLTPRMDKIAHLSLSFDLGLSSTLLSVESLETLAHHFPGLRSLHMTFTVDLTQMLTPVNTSYFVPSLGSIMDRFEGLAPSVDLVFIFRVSLDSVPSMEDMRDFVQFQTRWPRNLDEDE